MLHFGLYLALVEPTIHFPHPTSYAMYTYIVGEHVVPKEPEDHTAAIVDIVTEQ